MAESGVILPADSTGKALRTGTQTTAFTTGSGGVVHQQIVSVGDPTTAANLAGVTAGGALQVLAPDSFATGSLATLNDFVIVTTNGRGEVAFQLTGTWVGTVSFQGTAGSGGTPGSTWVPITAIAPSSSSAPITSTTTNGLYVVRVAGYTGVRVTFTAYTSGTATVLSNASAASTTVALGDPVTAPAITKGTQGTAGFAVQDLKDSGRTPIVLSATAVASVTTEALFTLNIWKAGVVTTGTSYTVTAGKTLRIQSMQWGVRFATPSTTVTFANARFNLRAIASGTLGTGSALALGDTMMAAANVPTPDVFVDVPDGLELPSGYVVGVSHADSAATLLLDMTIIAYEY